jgi:hypothetical protein
MNNVISDVVKIKDRDCYRDEWWYMVVPSTLANAKGLLASKLSNHTYEGSQVVVEAEEGF